jgi:hypothetical protein
VVAAWPTEYPGAAVLRVKIDADRVANAHLRTAACQRVTVEVGTDGKVTGLEAAPASHRRTAAARLLRAGRPTRGRSFLGPTPGHAVLMRQLRALDH